MLALMLITTLRSEFMYWTNKSCLTVPTEPKIRYRQNHFDQNLFFNFLISLQRNVDLNVTFENHLFNLKIPHPCKTIFVYIGFSQRLLIHAVRDLWAYSFLSLVYLLFCTKKLLQNDLLHVEMYSKKIE